MSMSSDTCLVCGERAHNYEDISTLHDGVLYRFCSDEHKEEFERIPGHFV
jgi:YHS domain-containing protein